MTAKVAIKRSRPVRLPLEPLLIRSGLDQAPQTTLAGLIAQTFRTVSRWAADGIPLKAAEDACDALSVHPCEVWGDDWTFAAGCPLAPVAAQIR